MILMIPDCRRSIKTGAPKVPLHTQWKINIYLAGLLLRQASVLGQPCFSMGMAVPLDHHIVRRKCDFTLFIFPKLPQQPFDLICESSEKEVDASQFWIVRCFLITELELWMFLFEDFYKDKASFSLHHISRYLISIWLITNDINFDHSGKVISASFSVVKLLTSSFQTPFFGSESLSLLLLLLSHFSRVRLCATPSLGFSRQEHWSGLPFPSPVIESSPH